MLIRFLLLTLVLFSSYPTTSEAKVIPLTGMRGEELQMPIGTYVSYYLDSSMSVTFEQAQELKEQKAFIASKKHVTNHGVTSSKALWANIRFDAKTDREYLLEVVNNGIDVMQMYFVVLVY